MGDRLRPSDLSLLATESATSPMHNATLEIFDPRQSGFDYDRLFRLIADRIAFVPRYRQRLLSVPARLANPMWVDDAGFDLGYHVRRSALPRPGNREQLRELVARIISRPLDRNRPLWEVYFIEGLEGGRVAVLAKSHMILVDGVQTVDLGQVLLDLSPERKEMDVDEWRPGSRVSPGGMLLRALTEAVERPGSVLGTVRANHDAAWRGAAQAVGRVGGVAAALTNRRPVPSSPLDVSLSQQRRFVSVETDLAAYRRIRRAHGVTVNDVILATVTGALRHWLMTRSESLSGLKEMRALVPMSVIDDEMEPTSLGSQVTGHLVDLPIGEASPVVRLHQVSYSFRAHKETGRSVAANRLAGIAGFAPTTFHALGARVAASQRRLGYQLAVTNVPGPQFPLYADGAEMQETYPVHPLLPHQALAIGVTSYDGRVFYGLTADRDALPDVDVLAEGICEALEELMDTTRGTRTQAPRGRTRASTRKATTRTSSTNGSPRTTPSRS